MTIMWSHIWLHIITYVYCIKLVLPCFLSHLVHMWMYVSTLLWSTISWAGIEGWSETTSWVNRMPPNSWHFSIRCSYFHVFCVLTCIVGIQLYDDRTNYCWKNTILKYTSQVFNIFLRAYTSKSLMTVPPYVCRDEHPTCDITMHCNHMWISTNC